MLNFVVIHKHCGYTKVVQGYNVWEALKQNNLDVNLWQVKEVYR